MPASSTKLYTPTLLALSSELANFPMSDEFERFGEARSRTCGSELRLGVDLDETGQVRRIGLMVSACAVGQSSAAIMARHAAGMDAQSFDRMLQSVEAWLAGSGLLPEWPGFDALEPALPHTGRHDALKLPWIAIRRALST